MSFHIYRFARKFHHITQRLLCFSIIPQANETNLRDACAFTSPLDRALKHNIALSTSARHALETNQSRRVK